MLLSPQESIPRVIQKMHIFWHSRLKCKALTTRSRNFREILTRSILLIRKTREETGSPRDVSLGNSFLPRWETQPPKPLTAAPSTGVASRTDKTLFLFGGFTTPPSTRRRSNIRKLAVSQRRKGILEAHAAIVDTNVFNENTDDEDEG